MDDGCDIIRSRRWLTHHLWPFNSQSSYCSSFWHDVFLVYQNVCAVFLASWAWAVDQNSSRSFLRSLNAYCTVQVREVFVIEIDPAVRNAAKRQAWHFLRGSVKWAEKNAARFCTSNSHLRFLWFFVDNFEGLRLLIRTIFAEVVQVHRRSGSCLVWFPSDYDICNLNARVLRLQCQDYLFRVLF